MAGETVCVTGASSLTASWLVKLLLERRYTVRGTFRSPGTPSCDFVSVITTSINVVVCKHVKNLIISSFATRTIVWNSKVSWPGVYLLALPFRVETLWCTQKRAKVWYPDILGSCGVRYPGQVFTYWLLAFRVETLWCTQNWAIWYPDILRSREKIQASSMKDPLGLHHANASCVSNLVRWIFINPYGCHVKGRASMWRAACFANKTFMRRHRSLSLLQDMVWTLISKKKDLHSKFFPSPLFLGTLSCGYWETLNFTINLERWSWCPSWFCFPVFGEGKGHFVGWHA